MQKRRELMAQTNEPLLSVKGLKQYFPVSKKFTVRAVDNISFDIYPGETYGLVGESGSGKSTTGRSIIRLYDPTEGTILFNGEDISKKLTAKQEKMLRSDMQMVFQDPMASLNPHKKILDTIAMGLDAHNPHMDQNERVERVSKMMEMVGLNPAYMNRYPNQFSGGQRQRIGLGRALIMNPKLVIADEAISALDVSIQAQVVNMFEDLQQEMGLTYLFIAHDLSVVKHISNRIGVMYLGKMVELADSYELITHSIHPYTRSLISAIPVADPITARQSKRIVLQGDVPSPLNPPSGCRFRTRCPYADEQCANEVPEFKEVSTGHWAACHHLDRVK